MGLLALLVVFGFMKTMGDPSTAPLFHGDRQGAGVVREVPRVSAALPPLTPVSSVSSSAVSASSRPACVVVMGVPSDSCL